MIALVAPNPKAFNQLAEQAGKSKLSMTELCRDAGINKSILSAIQKYGREAGLNRMEIPTKIKICSEEWTPDSGLVTAAFKIRRKDIQNYYKADINRLYGIDEERDIGQST